MFADLRSYMAVITMFLQEFSNFPLLYSISLAVMIPTIAISMLWMQVMSQVAVRRRIHTCVIRIMLMVPIYSTTAWVGLRFPFAATYVRLFRECYESIALYSFFNMLLLVLGNGSQSALLWILAQKPPQRHLWPLCNLPIMRPGPGFLWWNKLGVLQFVWLKPLLSLLTCVFEAMHIYGEGRFSPSVAYPYIAFVASSSQMVAIYALTVMYLVVADDLSRIRPIPKFVCIKLIIFMVYWQGVLLSAVHDYIPDNVVFSADFVSSQINELFILLEMLPFALYLTYSFRPTDFLSLAGARRRGKRRYIHLRSRERRADRERLGLPQAAPLAEVDVVGGSGAKATADACGGAPMTDAVAVSMGADMSVELAGLTGEGACAHIPMALVLPTQDEAGSPMSAHELDSSRALRSGYTISPRSPCTEDDASDESAGADSEGPCAHGQAREAMDAGSPLSASTADGLSPSPVSVQDTHAQTRAFGLRSFLRSGVDALRGAGASLGLQRTPSKGGYAPIGADTADIAEAADVWDESRGGVLGGTSPRATMSRSDSCIVADNTAARGDGVGRHQDAAITAQRVATVVPMPVATSASPQPRAACVSDRVGPATNPAPALVHVSATPSRLNSFSRTYLPSALPSTLPSLPPSAFPAALSLARSASPHLALQVPAAAPSDAARVRTACVVATSSPAAVLAGDSAAVHIARAQAPAPTLATPTPAVPPSAPRARMWAPPSPTLLAARLWLGDNALLGLARDNSATRPTRATAEEHVDESVRTAVPSSAAVLERPARSRSDPASSPSMPQALTGPASAPVVAASAVDASTDPSSLAAASSLRMPAVHTFTYLPSAASLAEGDPRLSAAHSAHSGHSGSGGVTIRELRLAATPSVPDVSEPSPFPSSSPTSSPSPSPVADGDATPALPSPRRACTRPPSTRGSPATSPSSRVSSNIPDATHPTCRGDSVAAVSSAGDGAEAPTGSHLFALPASPMSPVTPTKSFSTPLVPGMSPSTPSLAVSLSRHAPTPLRDAVHGYGHHYPTGYSQLDSSALEDTSAVEGWSAEPPSGLDGAASGAEAEHSDGETDAEYRRGNQLPFAYLFAAVNISDIAVDTHRIFSRAGSGRHTSAREAVHASAAAVSPAPLPTSPAAPEANADCT